MRRSLIAVAAAAVLVASAPRPAGAIVLDEDVLAEKATELGVVIRSFLFGFFGDVLDQPFSAEDADPSASAILDLRLYASHRTPSWSLVVHNQLTATVRSHGSLGPIGLGRGVEPPRLLPLRFEATDQPTLVLASTVDWLYATYSRGTATLTVGRQPVTFGRGKLWKPTDLIGTFALTEVDTEYKPGADAIRLDYSKPGSFNLTVVAATGELEGEESDLEATLDGTSALGRISFGLERGEIAGLAGFVRGDAVVGADGLYDAGGFDVYGEATATVVTGESLESPERGSGDVVARAVAGATWRTGKLTLSPELSYNGFGSFDADDYLAIAQSDRVAVGEQITFGRAYAALTASRELHPLVTLSGATLVNVVDPSALASVVLSYNVADNVQAAAGGYAGFGSGPELAPPAAGSEYGLIPYFFFAHLKAVI